MAEMHDVERTAARSRDLSLSFNGAILLLCVVFLALQAGCREESTDVKGPSTGDEPAKIVESESEKAAIPRIVMDGVEHDFGEIGPRTTHQTAFKFKNGGGGTLKITQVRSCCGVVTKGVKAGQEYAPGESGVLEISYTATLQPGSMRRTLYIESNDPFQSTVALTIRATIKQRVTYEPRRMKLFLNMDNAGAKDITIASLDGKPFAIKGFRSTAKSMAAEFDPTVEATQFLVKPKVDMERLSRNLRGQISIDLTHPECRNIRLQYDVMSQFAVDREQIMLFNLKAGEPVQREIWVFSNYQEAFEIESVTSVKGSVKLAEQRQKDSRYALTLEITPPPVESERAVMSDEIKVKIKNGPTLSIQCRGFYQGK